MGSRRNWLRALILAQALGLAGPGRAEEAPVPDAARAHFKMGLEYLNDPAGPRYEDALREFSAARDGAPSSWKTLNNIGLCALNLERDQEAIDAYQQALALAGDQADPEWRRQVERDVATLKAGLVHVSIRVEPVGASLLDERIPASGKPVLNRYDGASGSFELGIHAGHHRITAIAGRQNAVWVFDATAGAQLSHEFSLVAPPPPAAARPAPPAAPPLVPVSARKRAPTLVQVGMGVTGALLLGAGVTGYLALAKHDAFRDRNTGENPRQAAELRKTGKQLARASDVLLGVAVLAAGGTAALYFTRPAAPAERSQARLRIAPSVGPGSAWMTVSGRF